MICPGCGGRVGYDCFNPTECQWIAQDQQRQQGDPREVEAMADEITRLRADRDTLLAAIEAAHARWVEHGLGDVSGYVVEVTHAAMAIRAREAEVDVTPAPPPTDKAR